MKTFSLYWTISLAFLFPALSSATLGEAVDSPAKNLSMAKMSQKVSTSTEKYSVHEYEQNGNTVREYADSSGVVFAVGWNGISKPDLDALFGSYYSEYKDAFANNPRNYGTKSVSLKTSKLVIHRSGRMRDQHGFAYVQSLVPEGVNVEDLK